MFTFRREQLEALEADAARDFHLRLMAFLREEMPEQTAELSEEELSSFITDAEHCAAMHGIESDLGVAQYACLGMAVGPRFADIPVVAIFLREPGTDPEQQLEDLIEFMDFQLDGEDE